MDIIALLQDLYRHMERQAPGGAAETCRAMELACLDRTRHLKIADIGCGTGASALLLARILDAEITAVDFLSGFLRELETRASQQGVADRITTLECSMDALPFSEGELDVIWSEGAVYNMGFKAGISYWRDFLKPGGQLIVSEITWLSGERPMEIQSHWEREYPEIGPASEKLSILERSGFLPEAYFVLPEHCWIENFYRPLQGQFDPFLRRHGGSDEAQSIVDMEIAEIALHEKYSEYFGYGFYVARRL